MLWGVQWYGNVSQSWAQEGFSVKDAVAVPQVSGDDIKGQVKTVDQHVAKLIKTWSEEGVSFGISREQVDQAANATLSAQVRTTPGEVWQTFREQGSQAVVQSIAKNAELSVNDVSTKVMDEARYQYCLGVVDTYEQHSAAQ